MVVLSFIVFGEESELPETLDDVGGLALSFGDKFKYDFNLLPVAEILDSFEKRLLFDGFCI